jgi:cyd operon protein YbgE
MTKKIATDMSSDGRKQGDARARIPYPTPGWSRLVSMLMAVALSALILVYPHVVATSVSDVNHGLFNLLMWGIAIGFIHGVGFVPRMTIWRIVFSPFVGWPLMVFGLALTLIRS